MINLGSVVLGLCACGLGLAALAKRGNCCLNLGSFICCTLALVFQLFEIRRRVALADWSAPLDTVPAVTTAAVWLLIITTLFNLLALVLEKKQR